MIQTLPDLPYGYDALAPYLSETALRLHHRKHERAFFDNVAYVEKLRASVLEIATANRSLEDIIEDTAGQARCQILLNNAVQAWNHQFYWQSMQPRGGGAPYGEIAQRITAEFGSHNVFKQLFTDAVAAQIGNGWVWLVLDDDRLKITQTANTDTPLALGQIPLLTLDVWEHAYRLDYQSRRVDYANAVVDHLLNWDFANRNLARWNAAALLSPAATHVRAGAGL